MRSTCVFALLISLLGGASPLHAQVSGGMASGGPPTYMIKNIRVDGAEKQRTRQFVIQSSGLSTGETVTLPSGSKIADAIRAIYETGLFSDVAIHRENQQGNKVSLVIEVTPEPTLANYSLEGIKGRHEDDLKEKIPLTTGRPVRPADVARTRQVIKDFYGDKGHLRTKVKVKRTEQSDGNVALTFNVDRNKEVEVERIRFAGNETFDDGKLRGAMEETRENRWWRFWKGEKFKKDAYEKDLEKVVDHYRQHGYYNARIVSDSVYYVSDEGIGVDVTVKEGDQYYVRNISWKGNTVFPDKKLTARLGIEEGEVFDAVAMNKNILANKKGTDVRGLYMNRGYMRAQVEPSVRVVADDSVDVALDVREGEIYEFGEITIAGNTKTNDYVIRRELYTVPGERFSRSSIQESIRRLSQLSYFSKQSLKGGPEIDVDEQKKVADLTYSVEETGSDELSLSGTFGQFGIVLQLGLKFKNFSAQNFFNADAWQPLPTGDGQKLSINVRTNGRFYQNYSLSFTEPWFRGRPTPIGGSLSYSRYTRSFFGGRSVQDGLFQNFSSSFFVRQRLDWPDDKFETGTQVEYQLYDNQGFIAESGSRRNVGLFANIPVGQSQSISLRQSLTRNSISNPRFPRSGSKVLLSAEVAPPLGGFEQYHKWKLETDWNVPLGDNFSFGVGTNFGYIGTLTGDPVRFERFEVGGTAFDYQGLNFGTDPVYMRGYPRGVIGPKVRTDRGGLEPAGGRILNKYTAELRWMASESRQLQARPYLFLDAAGAWGGIDTYNPANLYRSAGIGVQLFLPIVGQLDFNYGYNFDRFVPLNDGQSGVPSWTFQFSLGGQ
ncbi:MAG: outer membrane protein assembly factor BamA [Bacteroidetes bacterium SW_9_63_38]|nr:MAG: outer membrane protein assembly factor BamA [Bacteroidetes bacterium SW_9_63_38]